MRNSSLFAASALLACVTGQATATENAFKYNYLEAGYTKSTADAKVIPGKMTGYAYVLTGSYAAHEMVSIQAGYGRDWGSWYPPGFSESFDGNGLALGIDLHHMIAPATEVGLDWSRSRSMGAATFSGTGLAGPEKRFFKGYSSAYGVRARTAIMPVFWLEASVGRSIASGSSSTDYGLSGEYLIGRHASVRLEYAASTDSGGAGHSHGFGIAGRYYF